MQESLTEVITQVRDLRTRIQSGTPPEKDAQKLLADVHKQRAKGVAKIAPTKSKCDGAQATREDPRGSSRTTRWRTRLSQPSRSE
jgi:hypothetical protein